MHTAQPGSVSSVLEQTKNLLREEREHSARRLQQREEGASTHRVMLEAQLQAQRSETDTMRAELAQLRAEMVPHLHLAVL
jgi:hypothetical protein